MLDADGAALPPHPEIWALSELLRDLGLDHSEAFALGVSGGAGFLGVAFRYDRDDFSNLHISGWNPFQSGLLAGAGRLGLTGSLEETSSKRKAAKALHIALADGEAAALWVDGASLGLAPAALDGMSPTVVVARGLAEGGVRVASAEGPAQVVEPHVLLAARTRIRSHRHRLLTLRGLIDDLPAAVRSGLADAAVGPVGGPKGNGGPEGVAELARRIDGEGRGSWRSVFAGDRHLLGALVNLHAAVTREGGLLRSGQAEFERYAAELLGMPELSEVAGAHDRLAAAWREIADAGLPADVPGLAAARGVSSALRLPPALAEAPFPLSATETDELLAGLAARVAALAADEADTLELLRSTLRSD